MSEVKPNFVEFPDRAVAFEAFWAHATSTIPETVPRALVLGLREMAERGFVSGALWFQVQTMDAVASLGDLRK